MRNKSGRIAPRKWSTHGFEFEGSRETLHGHHAWDCEVPRSQPGKYREGDVTTIRIVLAAIMI